MKDKVERQREHFDNIAHRYYVARRHENHLLLKRLIWNDFFSDKDFLKVPGLHVLEAMCGYADGKAILEENLGVAIRYSGFDYSGSVIERLNSLKPDLHVFQQDITTFSSTDSYDAILLIGGLHHVPDAASAAVKTLAASLRSGGYFINLEPTNGNWLFGKIRERIYRGNELFDQQTERAFDVDELFSMFRNAGLGLVDATYPGLLSYVLYCNPDAFPALNVGGTRLVRLLYYLERPILRLSIARLLSFATLTLWRKPQEPVGGQKVSSF